MYIKKDFEKNELHGTFDDRVKAWKEWLDTDRTEALKYYKENLFPDIIKKCAENTKEKGNASEILNPDYMILTVGTSFEPLVLSISTIQPQKEILFLYTKETRPIVNSVTTYLELSNENYVIEEVDSSSTVKIDRIVKEQYGKWKRNHENDGGSGNGRVVIDFTGGTKAMSGGGAMSALLIDAKLVYVASDYDSGLRMPKPGSEYVDLIKNPHMISGAIEYEKALKLFEEGDYNGAYKIISGILPKTRGSEYEKYNLFNQLSYVYSCWENLNFETALNNIVKLIGVIEAHKTNETDVDFLRGRLTRLYAQKTVLESLHKIYGKFVAAQTRDTNNSGTEITEIFRLSNSDNNIGNLIFYLYTDAQRTANRGNYNTAVILLYRMNELISRRRLALRGINVLNSIPSEDNRKVEQALMDTYQKSHVKADLGNQMTQYAYLKVLNDDIFNNLEGDASEPMAKLRELRANNDKRNTGFYIHGFKNMGKNDYESAEKNTVKWLQRFCKAENIDFDSFLENHTFLTPKDFM